MSPSIITSTPQPSQATGSWAGRISLRIEADPVQFFSAGFELTGLPAAGALVLTSPLGTVLGTLRWAPGQALLDRGDGKNPERFDSVAELLRQSTGAELPLEALFAWLGNSANPPSAPGWQADLSRRSEGRITARRSQPLPEADLRIVLDISATPSAP